MYFRKSHIRKGLKAIKYSEDRTNEALSQLPNTKDLALEKIRSLPNLAARTFKDLDTGNFNLIIYRNSGLPLKPYDSDVATVDLSTGEVTIGRIGYDRFLTTETAIQRTYSRKIIPNRAPALEEAIEEFLPKVPLLGNTKNVTHTGIKMIKQYLKDEISTYEIAGIHYMSGIINLERRTQAEVGRTYDIPESAMRNNMKKVAKELNLEVKTVKGDVLINGSKEILGPLLSKSMLELYD